MKQTAIIKTLMIRSKELRTMFEIIFKFMILFLAAAVAINRAAGEFLESSRLEKVK